MNEKTESLLRRVRQPGPSAALVGRILADAERAFAPRWRTLVWPFGPVWKPASVLAAAAVIGIGVGLYAGATDSELITYEIEAMLAG
jgi:hypothetical protein